MYRNLIFYILIFFLIVGCGTGNPSDDEMIENFYSNEGAFERIKEIAQKYGYPFYYPPYDERDTVPASKISIEDRKELDSLINQTKIIRVFNYEKIGIMCVYHSWGLSITGGSKEYLYDENLQNYMKEYEKNVAKDPTLENYNIERLTIGDLEEVASRYSVNLFLYRPIKNNWYIYLERDY